MVLKNMEGNNKTNKQIKELKNDCVQEVGAGKGHGATVSHETNL